MGQGVASGHGLLLVVAADDACRVRDVPEPVTLYDMP